MYLEQNKIDKKYHQYVRLLVLRWIHCNSFWKDLW